MTLKATVLKVMRACNNYFNDENNAYKSEREISLNDLPNDFVDLCQRIDDYIKNTTVSNITNETSGDYSVAIDIDKISFTVMFANDLKVYKRLKGLTRTT